MHSYTRFLPILTILLVTIAVLPATITHAQNETIPLEWYQAGHIKPGYEITIQLHGVGMVAFPIPLNHAFADSGVEFQGHRYGIIGTDGSGPTVDVYYLIDGQEIKIDTFHYGKKEYDAYVKITAYCPGEQPDTSLSKPDNSHFWVHIDFNGQYEKWNLLQLGGTSNTAVPLQLFYEQTPGLESWARISDTLQFEKCGGNIIGNPPTNNQDTRNDNNDNNGPSRITWLLVGIGVAILLVILVKLPI